MNTALCPDKEALFGYVVGTIPEDEAETVAEHLTSCPECQQTVEALEGLSDTMISALRQPVEGDAFAEEPECGQVLKQLRLLQIGRPESPSQPPPIPVQNPPSIKMLGDYEILEKLGEGGMGAVYKARHTRLKRIVALKVLPKNRLGNEDAVARFEREIEAVGRLDHQHIVRAMDAREVNGIRFLVMEYVDGLDLSEVVKRHGPLNIADACEAIRQAALGLSCSQENGLVHRDIKPSNLMLSTEGQVKILDLGLAQIQEAEKLDGQITGVGQVMGTPDYIAPEQAEESHDVDIRTDIYSLGCTLYYLLAGSPPFCAPKYDSPMKKVAGHIRDTVPSILLRRPEIPKPIAVLLERMVAKDPRQRVARPSDVSNALAPFCEGSKLIGLLRDARRKAEQDEEKDLHIETDELRVSAKIETSRDEMKPVASMDAESKPVEKPSGDPAKAEFDPYHRWLGIPPEEQTANHYRMLGLALFESNAEVIRDAAARQMAHVRTYHLGQHAELSQKILNELGAAQACLLNPSKKAAYDAALRKKQSSPAVEPPKLSDAAHINTLEDLKIPETMKLRPPLTHPWFGKRKPPTHWLIAAGAAAAFALVLGIVIYITTDKGSVKIALSDPKAKVEVKVDGDEIELAGLEEPLRLKVGEHELTVTGRDYETKCRSFTVKRGEDTVVTVELGKKKPSIVPPITRPGLGLEKTPESLTKPGLVRPSPPWMGYSVVEPVDEDVISHFAKYTNVIVDYSWSEFGDKTILAAKKAGLKVMLAFYLEKHGEDVYQTRAIEMAKRHRDAVFAVCWSSPNFRDVTPSELSNFGQRLKVALPEIEFWCNFVEAPRGNMTPMEVPDEVDRFIVTFYCSPNRQEVVTRELSILPKWLQQARGRSVLLGWSAWDVNPPGIAAKCEPGTIRRCHQVVKNYHLDGLIISNYGKSGEYKGVEVNPGLIKEIEETAQDILRKEKPLAADSGFVDILPDVDIKRDRVEGEWIKDGGTLATARDIDYSRVMLPVEIDGEYDLITTFTRHTGDGAICLMLPVGERRCKFSVSGRNGQVSGLDEIDGQRVGNNSTTRRPSTLINQRKYEILAKVRLQNGDAKIDVFLDNSPLVQWQGKESSLSMYPQWELPQARRPGLGAHGVLATFHSTKLRMVSGKAIRADNKAVLEAISTAVPEVGGEKDKEGLESLFNGKTLDGWHSIGPGKWTVEDGVIVGRKSGAEPGQGQLVSDTEYADFTLRLKFKVPKGDSGIYFRGIEGGKQGFYGLQLQIRPPDDVGGIIELLAQDFYATVKTPSPLQASQRMFRPNDWNDLELADQGGNITARINGVITSVMYDANSHKEGKIAIQLFGNEDTEVLIKDIQIQQETGNKDDIAQQGKKDDSVRQEGIAAAADDKYLDDQWIDLLKDVNLTKDVVKGKWKREGTGLTVAPEPEARVMLQTIILGGYDLHVEFTRKSGDQPIGISLPTGSTSCNLFLSAWNGRGHGLEIIDGRGGSDSPVLIKPGNLENNRKYAVDVRVRLHGDDVAISAQLDGKPLLSWPGKQASLKSYHGWLMPDLRRLGVGAWDSVTFQSVKLRRIVPSNLAEFEGHYYKVFDTPMTWHLAKEYCEKMGGHLVQIDSAQKQEFVKTLVGNNEKAYYYIDGTDEAKEGEWHFSDGKPIIYKNWHPGEPDNKANCGWEEHCMVLYVRNEYKWSDCSGACRDQFLCEWDSLSNLAAMPEKSKPALVRIPKDSIKFGGHHYKLFDTPVAWYVARQRCEAAGGHLARIESPEKQKFIENLISSSKTELFAIDGSDARVEGTWEDSGGNKLKYFNWDTQQPKQPKQPNNAGEGEHELYVHKNGHWHDGYCGFRTSYICEWDR